MDINVHEIRILLGMCVRGLHDLRDTETNDLQDAERMEIGQLAERLSEIHWDLRPWAPDAEDIDGE